MAVGSMTLPPDGGVGDDLGEHGVGRLPQRGRDVAGGLLGEAGEGVGAALADPGLCRAHHGSVEPHGPQAQRGARLFRPSCHPTPPVRVTRSQSRLTEPSTVGITTVE